MHPRIKESYELFTPESVEQGDTEEYGWIDDEGVSMLPDEYDREENLTPVDLAVTHLVDNCATEASSSHFHPGVWYRTTEPIQNRDYWEQGHEEYRSFSLDGFTEEQQAAIFTRIAKG